MTDDEIRIAIAEACGWHVTNLSIADRPEVVWVLYDPTGKEVAFGRDIRPKDLPTYAAVFSCDYLPDYLNDLNAAHEATAKLVCDELHCADFMQNLRNILRIDYGYIGSVEQSIILQANPRQRAEALLRTIGKWME